MAHLTKQKQRLMVRNPSLSPLTNRRSKVTMAKVWVLQLPVFYYTLRSLIIKAQCSHSYNGGIVVSSIATQTRNHGFEHVQHTNGCCHPLQRAMDIYHQEFNRLQQTALAAALRAHQTDGDMPGSISSRDENPGRDDGDDNNDNNDQMDKPSSPDVSERSGANSPSDCGQDSPISKLDRFIPCCL